MDALGINLSDVGICLFAMADLPVGSRARYLYAIDFLVDSDHHSVNWTDVTTIPDRQALPRELVTDAKHAQVS